MSGLCCQTFIIQSKMSGNHCMRIHWLVDVKVDATDCSTCTDCPLRKICDFGLYKIIELFWNFLWLLISSLYGLTNSALFSLVLSGISNHFFLINKHFYKNHINLYGTDLFLYTTVEMSDDITVSFTHFLGISLVTFAVTYRTLFYASASSEPNPEPRCPLGRNWDMTSMERTKASRYDRQTWHISSKL